MKTNLSFICQILQLNEIKTKILNLKQAHCTTLNSETSYTDILTAKGH